jgi:hypothetical protein
MNVTVPYTHARKLYDLAWAIKAPTFERKIFQALTGHPKNVTVNMNHDEYVALIQALRRPPRRAKLTYAWVTELLRTLNEYTLPILVEATLESDS